MEFYLFRQPAVFEKKQIFFIVPDYIREKSERDHTGQNAGLFPVIIEIPEGHRITKKFRTYGSARGIS